MTQVELQQLLWEAYWDGYDAGYDDAEDDAYWNAGTWVDTRTRKCRLDNNE